MAVQSDILANIGKLFRAVRGGGRVSAEDQAVQEQFRRKYKHFQELLESNAELLKIVSDMEVKLRGEQVFGMSYVNAQATRAVFHALRMAASYENLCGEQNQRLRDKVEEIQQNIKKN